MKLRPELHRASPWLVHEVAHDFVLEDVWQLPVDGDDSPGSDFAAFTELMTRLETPTGGMTGMLFRLRNRLGEWFGWDQGERLPIPGCEERSIAARLPAALRQAVPPFDPTSDFQLVYDLPQERLLELSNGTVHALMHLAWVPNGDKRSARMAVYAKARGTLGRAYMALIKPFRLFVVYPALLRFIGRLWRTRPGAALPQPSG